MRKAWKAGILVAVGLMALLFVACGGGGGGGEGGQTPTPASGTPTAGQAVGKLVQITGNADFTLTPNIIELKMGETYQVQLLNRGDSSYRLRIPRWDIMLFAPAGKDSELSNVFTPDLASDYPCYEEFNASRHDMRCTVKVSQ